MKKIIYFLPAVLYYAFIFYLSSRSSIKVISIYPFDKLAHFAEFMLLAILLFFGFSMSLKKPPFIKASLTFLFSALFAVGDEVHQRFVPGRYSELVDVAADLAGITVGIVIFWYISRGFKLKIYD
ncbi:MAG: VanZ family protein [Candidatus Aminicenantales bacterium]